MRERPIPAVATALLAPLCLCFAAEAVQSRSTAPTPSPPSASDAPAPGGLVVVPERDPKFDTGEKVQSAEEQAGRFLSEQKLRRGFNPDSRLYIAIGTHSYMMPLDSPASVDGLRDEAFWLAMLDAKEKIVGFMGTKVQAVMERRVRSISATGELGPEVPGDDAYASAETYRKLEDLMKGEVDSRAAAAMDGKDKRQDLAKQVVLDERFKQAVRSACEGEVAGAQAFRTFESIGDDGSAETAVVLATNDTSRELVRALVGGGPAPSDLPGESISLWAEQVGAKNLLYTHGAHVRTNERGEVVLVAFGQSTPQNGNALLKNEARAHARLSARVAAQLFLGDLIEAQAQRESVSAVKVFQDASESAARSKDLLRQLRARARDVELAGGDERHTWTYRHPLAKFDTHGYVYEFSLSGAEAANELRRQMEGIAPSKGGGGVRPPAPGAAPPKPWNGSSGAGAPGQILPNATKGGAGASGRF